MTLVPLSVLLAGGVLQQDPADQACGPVRGLGDALGWLLCQADAHSSALTTLATVLGALATLGLLVVGILTLRRRWRRRGEGDQTDAADARIANLAYPVRRTLKKSLEEGWQLDVHGIEQAIRAREIQMRFNEHEPRIENMLDAARDASSEIEDDTRRAARLFWSAADGVNDMAAFEPQHFGHEPSDDVFQGYREAKSTTEECVEILRRLDAPIRDGEG